MCLNQKRNSNLLIWPMTTANIVKVAALKLREILNSAPIAAPKLRIIGYALNAAHLFQVGINFAPIAETNFKGGEYGR